MDKTLMDIESVVVGGGGIASLVVLKPHTRANHQTSSLPIRIGSAEATAIGRGTKPHPGGRPLTHDLLLDTISQMGGAVSQVLINDVEGTTFFARIEVTREGMDSLNIDARPSDAIALAVRCDAPIFVTNEVLDTAALPDFAAVKSDEQERELEEFHSFLSDLTPDDFTSGAAK